jgi:hypothetical protein
MAIVQKKPKAPPEEKPKEPVIAEPEYKGVVVDSRYTPNTALMTHVEGSSWTVAYYSQVLDEDNPLAGQNVTMPATIQQYKLVNGFELKVTQPLTTSQDPQSKAMLVTGSANVYPSLIPNKGDMFVADTGDGRAAIFTVMQSERKSMLKDAVFAIEYQLTDYATDIRMGDLNAKVIDKVQFVRDYLTYGKNPLLRMEDYEVVHELRMRWGDITQRYFKSFVSNEFKTLLVPQQGEKAVYDPFLTKAVMSFFTTYDAPDIREVRILNVSGDDFMDAPTIWDALKNRDINLLKFCNSKAGLVFAREFDANPMLNGIYFSGVDYVVYPKDPQFSIDFSRGGRAKTLLSETLKDSPAQIRRLADLLGDRNFEGLTKPDSPPVHNVMKDDYYVFTAAFYNNASSGQSVLERLVRDFLQGEALNNKALLALCETYHAWGSLERFYYVPILLMLIKTSIREI